MRLKIKPGDILICIDEDNEDEDLGMSGIVLKGNKNLTLNQEYEILSIDEKHVQKIKHKDSVWKNDSLQEFHDAQDHWVMVSLQPLPSGPILLREWLHNFKKK
ncbi:MAG: hypothetical protein ABIP51_20170 [Bacteroidia bacterium]